MNMTSQSTGTKTRHDGRADEVPDAVKSGADKMFDFGAWPISVDMQAAAHQSRQSMEAVTQFGTVLTLAFQKSSQSWTGIAQEQWKRDLDGMQKLMQAKSIHEFGTIQGELVRKYLEHSFNETRSIAQSSRQMAAEAWNSLAGLATQGTAKEARALTGFGSICGPEPVSRSRPSGSEPIERHSLRRNGPRNAGASRRKPGFLRVEGNEVRQGRSERDGISLAQAEILA